MGDGSITLHNRTTAAGTPAAGRVKLYALGDDFYQVDDQGNVKKLVDIEPHAATHQSGGDDEISVAGLSGLLADPQVAAAHASSHQNGGVDEVEVSELGTSETDTGKRLAPNGTGGVAWVAGGGGSSDPRDVLVMDHFVTGNVDTDEVGSAGWRASVVGTGSDLAVLPTAGHPGVLSFGCGTAAGARAAIHLGETAIPNFVVNTSQNTLLVEWLVQFNANALLAANMDRFTVGLGDGWDAANDVEHSNGVYCDFEPLLSGNFRLRTAAGGVRSSAASSVAVAANTWYRIGIQMTYPGGVPTATLLINGVAAATLTSNIPSAGLGVGIRGDAAATALEARFLADYCLVSQVTAKET